MIAGFAVFLANGEGSALEEVRPQEARAIPRRFSANPSSVSSYLFKIEFLLF
jgi:hypothetical protein